MGEGRKREVRRLFAAIGLEVRDLVRVGVGPLQLGPLPEGEARALRAGELSSLRRAAGLPPRHAARPVASAPHAMSRSDRHHRRARGKRQDHAWTSACHDPRAAPGRHGSLLSRCHRRRRTGRIDPDDRDALIACARRTKVVIDTDPRTKRATGAPRSTAWRRARRCATPRMPRCSLDEQHPRGARRAAPRAAGARGERCRRCRPRLRHGRLPGRPSEAVSRGVGGGPRPAPGHAASRRRGRDRPAAAPRRGPSARPARRHAAAAPMRPAPDAHVLDTGLLGIDEVVHRALELWATAAGAPAR